MSVSKGHNIFLIKYYHESLGVSIFSCTYCIRKVGEQKINGFAIENDYTEELCLSEKFGTVRSD